MSKNEGCLKCIYSKSMIPVWETKIRSCAHPTNTIKYPNSSNTMYHYAAEYLNRDKNCKNFEQISKRRFVLKMLAENVIFIFSIIFLLAAFVWYVI